MIMNKKYFLMLFCILCSIHAMGQTAFYYYQGNKIPLTLNESKVCISIPKGDEKLGERIRSNVEVLQEVLDNAFGIYVVTRQSFDKLTSQDFWEEDSKAVILTSCYFTENNEEVFATPYLNVRLNKEEDVDLLNKYAEKYRLKNCGNSSLMPLWYILSVTQNSDISPLECANGLFESGDFAASVPDLAASDLLADVTAVRSFTTAPIEKSSSIYDLRGRKMQQPTKGIYIQDGRKVVVK